jgi:hypothetical protein
MERALRAVSTKNRRPVVESVIRAFCTVKGLTVFPSANEVFPLTTPVVLPFCPGGKLARFHRRKTRHLAYVRLAGCSSSVEPENIGITTCNVYFM